MDVGTPSYRTLRKSATYHDDAKLYSPSSRSSAPVAPSPSPTRSFSTR